MFRTKNKKIPSVITTHTLGKIILEQKIVPTPLYTSGREISYIVQPRGTIFTKLKRGKTPKF